ncbi:unnamed protein product [Ectocarpus sp. CCAP 1310/34]|nr:unnamed protein product [Ectocarpus sp. CCAP 1310/34]
MRAALAPSTKAGGVGGGSGTNHIFRYPQHCAAVAPSGSAWSRRSALTPGRAAPRRGGLESSSAGVGVLSMSGGGTDGGPAGAQDKRKSFSPEEGVSKGGVEGDSKVKVPWVSWVSLAMLLLVYISNQWTRSLVYYVQNFDVATTEATAKEFMNVSLGFDETQYGLLASFSFTLLFSTCSLIAGRAVDVVSRKTATVASCLVWSAMAAGTSVANGFPTVFGLRVLQGSAQAFTTPAAYTMISDLFPASVRGTANSIYSSGVYLGGALASLSLLLNGAIGWRDSHLVVAAVGVAVAVLSALLIQEPAREFPTAGEPGAGDNTAATGGDKGGGGAGEESEERESFQEALGIVFKSNTVRLVFLATAFRFCAGFGIGVWCAPFFRGRFPSNSSEYAVLNAFVVAGGGLLSSFLGGVVSDKYSVEDPRVRAWVPMAGCILAIPCWIGVVTGTNFYVSLAFLLAEYIAAECWFGGTVTILQEGLPPNVRGVGQGVFSTLSAFGTLAPPLMGYLIRQGGFELQDVLLYTVAAFYAISALFFFFVGESVLADHKRDGKLKEA